MGVTECLQPSPEPSSSSPEPETGQPAMTSLTVLGSLVLLSMATSTLGIKCFSCNSHYDRNCADPFNNYTSELVNCDQEDHRMTHLPLKNDTTRHSANSCRKTIQIVKDEMRIIRSCGWLPNPESLADRECFTRTGTHSVMVHHCVCKEDGCNGVASIAITGTLLLASLTARFINTA